MIILSLLRMAFPCAGLLHGENVHVESGTQQAIFSLHGDNTVVEYQIQYEGNAEDFGWMIPIFGDMVDIQEGNEDTFAYYDQITGPQISYEYEPVSSCGVAEKSDSSNAFTSERYVQGFAGQFEYLIIPASQGEDFVSWGEENGWNTDGVSSILPQYGSESNISLVLLKIRQDISAEDISTSPTIQIEYERHEMRYPAMLSKLSTEQELHTVVYIKGDAQATVGGWGLQEVGNIEGDISEQGSELYRARLREISESRTSFGLVFSGDIDGVWITRMDSLVRPEQNTHEPFFRFGNDREEVTTEIRLSQTSGAWMWSIFLVSCTILTIRRNNKNRTSYFS